LEEKELIIPISPEEYQKAQIKPTQHVRRGSPLSKEAIEAKKRKIEKEFMDTVKCKPEIAMGYLEKYLYNLKEAIQSFQASNPKQNGEPYFGEVTSEPVKYSQQQLRNPTIEESHRTAHYLDAPLSPHISRDIQEQLVQREEDIFDL